MLILDYHVLIVLFVMCTDDISSTADGTDAYQIVKDAGRYR